MGLNAVIFTNPTPGFAIVSSNFQNRCIGLAKSRESVNEMSTGSQYCRGKREFK